MITQMMKYCFSMNRRANEIVGKSTSELWNRGSCYRSPFPLSWDTVRNTRQYFRAMTHEQVQERCAGKLYFRPSFRRHCVITLSLEISPRIFKKDKKSIRARPVLHLAALNRLVIVKIKRFFFFLNE